MARQLSAARTLPAGVHAIALAALAFAGWRIYRPAAECKPGEVCAVPRVRRGYKVGFWIVGALLVAMLGFPYAAPLLY